MTRASLVLAICSVAFCAGAASDDTGSAVPDALRAAYARSAAIPYPESDAYSVVKERLGRDLFFDPILSGGRDIACSSCHDPALSWGDGRARAVGASHEPMALRSPTLIDVAWMDRVGWDGKFRDVEAVTFSPITAPDNMNLPEAAAIARLKAVPAYVQQFQAAFGTPDIDRKGIERALATFERSIVSGEAPFDRWMAGDASAVTPAAKRGFALFNGRAGCAACHSGWTFSDGSFHDIGTTGGDDIGRGRLFPTSVKLRYAFKTPTLRDVGRRAPYMHNGSLPSLRTVIDLYDRGGIDRPSRAEEIRPLGLTERDKTDLIDFLNTLTAEQRTTD